jgi:hypothetical protein
MGLNSGSRFCAQGVPKLQLFESYCADAVERPLQLSLIILPLETTTARVV